MAANDQRTELAMWVTLLLAIVGATAYLSSRLTKIDVKMKIISRDLSPKTQKLLDRIDEASAFKFAFGKHPALSKPLDSGQVVLPEISHRP